MKYVGMIIIGILGLIIGEGISRAIRKDPSTRGDDLTMTWGIKLVVAFLLMLLVYKGCD